MIFILTNLFICYSFISITMHVLIRFAVTYPKYFFPILSHFQNKPTHHPMLTIKWGVDKFLFRKWLRWKNIGKIGIIFHDLLMQVIEESLLEMHFPDGETAISDILWMAVMKKEENKINVIFSSHVNIVYIIIFVF